MQARVAPGVEYAQQDEPARADDGEDDGEGDKGALADGRVSHKAPAVPQPALRHEGEVERDGDDGRACNEERFELLRAHVADVGDFLALVHGRVYAAVGADDPVQQQPEEHAEPDETGEDWYHLQARKPWSVSDLRRVSLLGPRRRTQYEK